MTQATSELAPAPMFRKNRNSTCDRNSLGGEWARARGLGDLWGALGGLKTRGELPLHSFRIKPVGIGCKRGMGSTGRQILTLAGTDERAILNDFFFGRQVLKY